MGRKNDKIINSFTKVVKNNFNPCKIILFGSRATGKYNKGSDYDFLLISPKFRKMGWEDRLANVYFLKREIPAAMDIICLTPHEFNEKKKELGVIHEAVKEGIEIT